MIMFEKNYIQTENCITNNRLQCSVAFKLSTFGNIQNISVIIYFIIDFYYSSTNRLFYFTPNLVFKWIWIKIAYEKSDCKLSRSNKTREYKEFSRRFILVPLDMFFGVMLALIEFYVYTIISDLLKKRSYVNDIHSSVWYYRNFSCLMYYGR